MQSLFVKTRTSTFGTCLHSRELFGPTLLLGCNTTFLLQLYIFYKPIVCRYAVVEHIGRTVKFQRYRRAIENFINGLVGQFRYRSLQIGVVALQYSLNLLEYGRATILAERCKRTIINRQGTVGDNLINIHTTHNSKSLTLWAETLRRVERKVMWIGLFI